MLSLVKRLLSALVIISLGLALIHFSPVLLAKLDVILEVKVKGAPSMVAIHGFAQSLLGAAITFLLLQLRK
jgi:hypothetical protein